MRSRILISEGSNLLSAIRLTVIYSWIFLLGVAGILVFTDPVSGADLYRLEGKVGLPHAGRVKKKVQVLSFDVVTAPMRGGAANTGSVSSAPGQWRPRETYEYVEMEPLVFLRKVGDARFCRMADASRGSFEIEDLEAGNYRLIFAVPDLGSMEKRVEVRPESTDSDGKLEIEFEFSPEGDSVEPVEREKISSKAAKAFAKGVEEFNKGNAKKAFEEFEEAVNEDDHYAEAWEHMGIIRHSEENLDEAEEYFQKSIEIDPNSYRALADLGTILLLKGDPSGARDLYEKAILIRPNDPQPRTQIGMALFQLEEFSRALDHLAIAKTIDPEHFSQPQILAAEIFRIIGDRESVVAELNDFLEHFPNDPKVSAIKDVLNAVPFQ